MDVDRLMALVETYRATGGPKFRDEIRAAAQALSAPPQKPLTQDRAGEVLGPLLNAFGERQWQSGRGLAIPHEQIAEAFNAVIAAAVSLHAAPAAPAMKGGTDGVALPREHEPKGGA